ncbi:MAG TPA: class I SAM-dependent methyltransferase [Gemmatimonadales bacterium]
MREFADHFSRLSARYAAYRPRYPDGLFDTIAAAAGPGPVWDCATGTGQAALPLARRFATVVATDASRQQVRSAVPHPGVHYAVALAEAAPLRSQWAQLVTVAQALHWLDLSRFYPEVRRVLRPGGLFVAWTYGVHRVDGGAIDAVVEHFYDGVVGPYWAPERRLVETGYRTLDFPFEEVEIASPPVIEDWTLGQLLGYVSTWSAVAKCREVTGVDPILALEAELEPLWGDPGRRRRIEWPIAVRAGR